MRETAMNANKLLALVALFAVPAIVTGCDCGPGTARGTRLAFTAQPQGGQAGVPFIPAVQVAVTDDSGNVITDTTVQVTIALNDNPGADTLGGTLTQTTVEGVAIFSDLTLTKVAAGYTLKATSTDLADAVSSAFSISPGPPAALAFTQGPSDADAGAVIAPPITVSLVDAFGNQTTASGTMITIAVGTGPSGAALGGTTTVISVAGVSTFGDLTLDLEGSYTLTATSGSLPVLISSAFTIRPGPPASMAFTVQPTSTTAGTPIAPAVQVTLFDARGNVARGATSAVTINLGSNPGSGTLSGTLTRNAVNGVATFTDLSIDKVGAGYELRASSGALPGVTSSAFDISAAAPSRLAFVTEPTSAVAGTPIAPAVQVAILDAFGNPTASTAAVTVAIANNPGGSTLSGTLSRAAVAGVASFNDLSLNKVGTGYTLQASSAGLASATSAGFDIAASTPAQLVFHAQPSSADAGAAIAPAVEVELQDAFGNRTSSTATVTVALRTNPSGGTLAGTLSSSAVAGLATFVDLSIDKAGVGYTLQASSAGLPTIPSASFDIRAGPAAALVFQQQPTNAAAGALLSPAVQVTIVDAFGNQTGSGATVTLAIASGPPGATLGGTASQAAVAGLATFANLSLTTAGAYTLSAGSGGLTPDTSAPFTINAAAPSRLAFTVQPSNAQAAAAISPAVQVSIQDAFGNLTGSTATVTVALGNNPGGGTLSGTTSAAAVAGVATFNNLSINRSGNGYTLQASAPGLASATSAPFDIAAGPASRLTFTAQPSNSVAGVAITPAVRVSITDASGNVVTSSSATVTVALGTNPSGGTLSGTTSQAAVAGVATFSGLNVDKSGAGYTLTAASVGLTGATSNAFNISPGPASQLAFAVQPTNTVAGSIIIPSVRVSILDAFGNQTTSTPSVTVAIGTNPGGGTLGGATTVVAVAGVATFSNLSINRTGTGYTLTAASALLTGATSNTFNITVGPPASLAYVQQPTSTAAGAAIAPPITVAVVDAFGNQTTSTATVTLAIGTNPGGGTLSGTASQAAVAGLATFSNLSINRTGTGYTLIASSPGLGNAASAAFNIVPAAANRLVFTTPSRTITAGTCPGVANAITVQLQDAFGNPVNAPAGGQAFTAASTSTGVVTWFTDSACTTVAAGGTLNIAAGTSSVNVFYMDTRAGLPFVSLSNPNGLNNPAPQQHTIVPGAGNKLAFAAPLPGGPAGGGFSPAIQVVVQDALGNTVPSSTATVTLAIGNNPGGGTLGGTTIVAATAGVATFSNLSITTAGIGYTLIATSPGLISATSNPFDITPGPASQLSFTVQPSNAVAGAAITPVVQVSILDAFGNLTASTATVTAAIGTNPGGGTLSGTTSQAAVAGVATFNDLSINRAGTGYTLTVTSAGLTSATSNTFNILVGPASRLAFGQQPTNTAVSATISPAVTVLVQDAAGNTITGSTATVTMTIGANPGGGTLGGTTSVAAVAGVATFSTLSINAAGNGYTLQASSAGLTAATSNAFNITTTGSALTYTDPPLGGKIRLVRDAASTATTVVLDLVAEVPLTGFHVGFNLPLDTTRVQANATLQTPGTALPAGAAPIAAKAVLPAAGPLANVLVSGQSQKAAGAGATPANSAVPAGAVFYTLRLDLKAGATTGVVFDGAALGLQFAGTMRDRAGTDVAVSTDFRIGRLDVN
ncbi:MAG TPA: hypothetical protein VIG99_04085 [Myxococcaceae bacterium]|jgi:hypothetical protein